MQEQVWYRVRSRSRSRRVRVTAVQLYHGRSVIQLFGLYMGPTLESRVSGPSGRPEQQLSMLLTAQHPTRDCCTSPPAHRTHGSRQGTLERGRKILHQHIAASAPCCERCCSVVSVSSLETIPTCPLWLFTYSSQAFTPGAFTLLHATWCTP